MISVLGPLTGELYGEGYLNASGLTPEEFPAGSGRSTAMAYEALLSWAVPRLVDLLHHFVPVAVVMGLLILAGVLAQEPWMRTRTERLKGRWFSAVRGTWATSRTLRFSAATALSLGMAFAMVYLATAVLLVTIVPWQAHDFGLKQGREELARRSGHGDCDQVSAAPPLPAGCAKVVAHGDKFIAVALAGRVWGLPRESTRFDSPLPAAAAPASTSASAPSAR